MSEEKNQRCPNEGMPCMCTGVCLRTPKQQEWHDKYRASLDDYSDGYFTRAPDPRIAQLEDFIITHGLEVPK